MTNKEKIDYLLLDIRELEKLISGMRESEVYPVSFFSQTFDLAQKLLNGLHELEADQVEQLRRQMEEHQRMIRSIPQERQEKRIEEKEQITTIASESKIETDNQQIVEISLVSNQQAEEEIKEESPVTNLPIETEASIEMLLADAVHEKTSVSLNEILEKKNLSDFRKAFSLNDRFRFRRELFGGDEEKMNRAIAELNELQTYEDSVTYLNQELQWNVEDEAVSDFIRLLEKRFL
ncbi:hypothetical protein [Parabacteroides sp. PF5-9]|uniref:hypothetical protein n=1 Tax=Parabacteroides sp. PF5-9 TaxID=1742404 RepID=UPI002475D2AA|nr:hypothetical protein [Parabacteroides sp. PF5-9]MDH6356294.1 hypothetical protein [Parabacteroides sp. PF5-9]